MELNDYLQDPDASPYTLISETEVCAALHVRPRTLVSWRRRGFPHPLRIPGINKERHYHLQGIRDFIKLRAMEAERKSVAKSFTRGHN